MRRAPKLGHAPQQADVTRRSGGDSVARTGGAPLTQNEELALAELIEFARRQKPLTHVEIGRRLGVCRSRVQQLEQRALEKMRLASRVEPAIVRAEPRRRVGLRADWRMVPSEEDS